LVVVEFDNAKFSEDTEEWQMPDWATVVPPEAVNGAQVGFGRIGRYNIGTWFIGAGEGDASQLRSLRLCLLRLHAMQEVLDCLLRLIDGNDVLYQPYSDSGDRLSEFLNDMTSKIGARSTHGVSQSAIVAAMDASVSVETPGDAETRIANLGLARRQVAAKIRSYLRRRAAERQVVVFKGGVTVTTNNHNNDITINGPVMNSSVILAETMENVRVAIQNSDASPELKAALATLQEQAKQLAAQLPDDRSKKDVATAVETIATEACKPDPTEFLVRAAGDALIRAGTKVKECAEPIAKAVATVFTLLKLAVPGL
jgi:hypothetical protein